MPTIREKRVYDDAMAPTPVFVAAEQGLVVARISSDAVGEFSLARRCTARDVGVGPDGTVVLATHSGTLIAADSTPKQFLETGFGPAVAVSVAEFGGDRAVVAADETGEIARLSLPTTASEFAPESAFEAGDWEGLGVVEQLRAIDARLIATGEGVYRIVEAGLDAAGLDDVRDVAARGAPLAATGTGLYDLGNGWMVAREGSHEAVATDGQQAHAVAEDGRVFGRTGGDWMALAPPTSARIVDFGYTRDGVVAATESGSLLVNVGDGWRSRSIGVTGVETIAAGPIPE